MLVLDASALLAWLMPDETGPDLAPLLRSTDQVLAPWMLWVELRNILIVSERRGRLPAGAADQIVAAVDQLNIALDTRPANAVVLDLARRHGLSVYDALYLELALREGAQLASLDAALRRAASGEGVELAG